MNKPNVEGQSESMAADAVKKQLAKMTRRGFAIGGASILTGFGAWKWLFSRSSQGGLNWPLRKALEANESLSLATFSPANLAPEFPIAQAQRPRVNGIIGMSDDQSNFIEIDPAAWNLNVYGGPGGGKSHRRLSLDDIKALPRVEQVTELKCIEGWSTVVRWAGARLSDVAEKTGLHYQVGASGPPTLDLALLYRYVGMSTPDDGYYVGLDAASAYHPQTLLAYEMDGEPLEQAHGAPLRLVMPIKYGYKGIKRIGTIWFTNERPNDFWAEQGYDWYAGH